MIKLVVWGTGKRTKSMLDNSLLEGSEIVCFVDTYKKQNEFCGYKVVEPSQVSQMEFDYLIIPIKNPKEVYDQCKKLRIPDEKIIIQDNIRECSEKLKEQNPESIRDILPKLYQVLKQKELLSDQCAPIRRCLLDFREEYDNEIYNGFNNTEYIRYRTMELVSREVKDIEGDWCIAELGVWQGSTASYISRLFPERTIYLFDTFESFDESEVKKEIESGNCNEEFAAAFANTSVARVVERMPYRNLCEVRKGYFPTTAEGLENRRFGFVSLDVDLEESTYEGLKYFVPRMIEGGYIFLHDYNHVSLRGVKKAVERYERDYNIRLRRVPICDSDGTLVISL